MEISQWQKEARRRWEKQIYWIRGDGRYALLAWCRVLTITLWQTREEAKSKKHEIDELCCGGECYGNHEIIDLSNS